MSVPVVASIGTTHPWNVAGLGLDARVCAEYGVRNAGVVVAVSAQDERGVHALHAIPSDVVRAQLAALPHSDAYRVGALAGAENVRAVAAYLRDRALTAIVVDPVFSATLGGTLVDEATYRAFVAEIVPLRSIFTPNIPEAQRLLERKIVTGDEMISAAQSLQALGPRAVLLKGGHLDGDPVDVLALPGEAHVYRSGRLPGSMRGSGCVLAAALASELARGEQIPAAVESARAYVRAKIGAGTTFGTMQVAF